MHDNAKIYKFSNRDSFRSWLENNHSSSFGIWIEFEKGGKAFTSNDALEEAICYGWIDGLIKSIDERKYKKYFSKRKDLSKWSEKNQVIYKKLKENGLMTKHGEEVFLFKDSEEEPTKKLDNTSINIMKLKEALRNEKGMEELFESNSPSRKKQLVGFYNDAKTEATREKRRIKIIEALKTNYKGMLY